MFAIASHLIKSLNHHLAARKRQLQAYTAQLRQQYRDRLEYWASRGRSRSKGHELSLIRDSMDQAKFGFPRGPSMRSKDLSNFNRPRCHITGLILHGRARPTKKLLHHDRACGISFDSAKSIWSRRSNPTTR